MAAGEKMGKRLAVHFETNENRGEGLGEGGGKAKVNESFLFSHYTAEVLCKTSPSIKTHSVHWNSIILQNVFEGTLTSAIPS